MAKDSKDPVSRDQLYEEVWCEPMVAVAKRYGVSSSYMARVCADLNIPRPQRGYWAQLQVGKAPKTPPLPQPRAGDALEWSRTGSVKRVPVVLAPPSTAGLASSRRRGPRPQFHPLTRGVKESFLATWPLADGYLRPRKRNLVDVIATAGQLQRALDLAGDLFLKLEDHGHEVRLMPYGSEFQRIELHTLPGEKPYEYHRREPWAPDRATIVSVGTVAIGVTIFEIAEMAECRYVDGEFVRVTDLPTKRRHSDSYSWTSQQKLATGRLAIRAYSPYRGTSWQHLWSESGNNGDLKGQLKSIRDVLEKAAPTIVPLVEEAKRQQAEEARKWAAQWLQWEREERARKRTQAQKESIDLLTQIIADWSKAMSIQAFFNDLEGRAQQLAPPLLEPMLDRIREARRLVGEVDTLRRFGDWKTVGECLRQSLGFESESETELPR